MTGIAFGVLAFTLAAVLPPLQAPLPQRTLVPVRASLSSPTNTAALHPQVISSPASVGVFPIKAVLDAYDAKIENFHTPPTLSFEYHVDQAGGKSFSQSHRVYRSGLSVRDETFVADGAAIRPRICIYRNRINAYALENIAPRSAAYTFTFNGIRPSGKSFDYVFSTKSRGSQVAFTVVGIVLDGKSFLPKKIAFRSGTLNGSGNLFFGRVEKTWLIQEAVAVGGDQKHILREHILFTAYRFPSALPSSTFGAL